MAQNRVSPFSKPTAVVARTQETARNKLEKIDHCPVCDKLMLPVSAAGIPSYYCQEHRVCLPQKV